VRPSPRCFRSPRPRRSARKQADLGPPHRRAISFGVPRFPSTRACTRITATQLSHSSAPTPSSSPSSTKPGTRCARLAATVFSMRVAIRSRSGEARMESCRASWSAACSLRVARPWSIQRRQRRYAPYRGQSARTVVRLHTCIPCPRMWATDFASAKPRRQDSTRRAWPAL
jgi:hypothetical protein